jgi:predicted MFS family arabinose efflux permease
MNEKTGLKDAGSFWSDRNSIFKVLVFVTMVFNIDTGVFPPVLKQITKDLGIDDIKVAFLGTVTNFGNCAITLVFSPLLKHVPINKLLLTSCLINILCCALITVSFDFYVLATCRFMQGLTMGIFGTYTPIWINRKAPHAS